jgi:thioredoxin 1
MNKVKHVVLVTILAIVAVCPTGLQAGESQSHLASTSSKSAGISYDLLGLPQGKGQTEGQEDGAADSQPAESPQSTDHTPAETAPNESAGIVGGETASEPKDYLIYFTATWCGPCQGYKPTVQKIRKDGLIKVHEVDIDNNPSSASQWGVTSVPTTIIVKNGKVVARHNRPVPYTTLKGEISP